MKHSKGKISWLELIKTKIHRKTFAVVIMSALSSKLFSVKHMQLSKNQ